MTILLRQPSDLRPSDHYDQWLAIGGIDPTVLNLPADRMMPNVAGALEQAFEDSRELWWDIGRILAGLDSNSPNFATLPPLERN